MTPAARSAILGKWAGSNPRWFTHRAGMADDCKSGAMHGTSVWLTLGAWDE